MCEQFATARAVFDESECVADGRRKDYPFPIVSKAVELELASQVEALVEWLGIQYRKLTG
jgi:hypothetical protein